MHDEIEKKYLVAKIPEEIKVKSVTEIHQTYLAIGDDEEVRVRKNIKNHSEEYTMTIKKGKGLSRKEVELDISKETYEQLLFGSSKVPLIKTRKKVIIGHSVFDLDIYHNHTNPNLKTIEIEFDNVDEAESFQKPSWFGEDVTEDKNYKNQSLWKEIQQSKP